MLVVSVKETALEKFDLGDWVFAVNDVTLKSKRHYFSILKEFVLRKQPYVASSHSHTSLSRFDNDYFLCSFTSQLWYS